MKTRKSGIRIIGGRWRGRRVRFPEVEGLRPTPDRVRETVFNWLAPYVEGARVLDLFAGSGALGFEALSRGAARATFVDDNPAVARGLQGAARELQAVGVEVETGDGAAFLATPGRGPYDIVFIDPPYSYPDHGGLCAALESGGTLAPGAIVYVELPSRGSAAFEAPASWKCHRSASAGQVVFQLWRRREKTPGGGAAPD